MGGQAATLDDPVHRGLVIRHGGKNGGFLFR